MVEGEIQGLLQVRIAMGIEYDGAAFSGWQIQTTGARTIQGILEQAITRVAAQPIVVQCAGRTDAGVHAMGQVVHFDTTAIRSCRSWVLGCNANLPSDISVIWAQQVEHGFHARFSATGRHYSYVILNRPVRSALLNNRVSWIRDILNEALMQHAALALVGTHDFSSYRALGCQAKHPVRTVKYLQVWRREDHIFIEIGANAFLYHMVRNIVGVLVAIGKADKPVNWAEEILQLRDRTRGGVTASPSGLYLMQVDYPDIFGLPNIKKAILIY